MDIRHIIRKVVEENYPAGAEHDPSAPWNQVAPDPKKASPKEVFSLVGHNDEFLILRRDGKLYAYYHYPLETEDVQDIAIDYVGVEKEVDYDDDGNRYGVYNTDDYRSSSDLPTEAILDYVNANYMKLKMGVGEEGFEDGADISSIDDELRAFILKYFPKTQMD